MLHEIGQMENGISLEDFLCTLFETPYFMDEKYWSHILNFFGKFCAIDTDVQYIMLEIQTHTTEVPFIISNKDTIISILQDCINSAQQC